MKTKIISFCLLLLFTTSFNKAQEWEFVGLDSMIIYGLEVRGDTIWAGTRDLSMNDNSGLYKSIDQSQTWEKLDSSLGNKTVTLFSIDKNNSSKIFILKLYYQTGYFFRTTNNGLSWDSVGTPGDAPITDFIISPIDPNEYYVITHTRGHEWETIELFYKTTDAGNYWEYKCCPGEQEFGIVMTFAIDKINPNTLYISGASAGEFFRRSTDRGNTWQNLSSPNVSIVFLDFFIVNRIYLFNYSDKIYSDDGGVSWQNMAGDYTPNAHFISGYQDSKTSIIYAWFNEGLFYSENDNIYWRLIPGSQNLPVIQPSIYARTMKNISTDNNFIYIGTANGIYKTDYATGIDDISNNTLPAEYYLSQNYPNPFITLLLPFLIKFLKRVLFP
ncbi:MAG: hypothetical protein IPM56_04360 [Ignavibacteriales bacterium]|nr:MAG: hypothetical protein IPM56_04360 [Ignavibacteriales bacterium]